MIRTRILLLAGVFAASLLAPTIASAQAPVKIEMATLAPRNSPWATVFRAAAKEVEKETNGAVKIVVYFGGSRGDEKKMIRKMRSDQLQGAAITSVGLSVIAKEILVLQTPGLIRTYKQLDYVREKLRDRFTQALDKEGFVLLGWGDVGYTYFLSAKEVKTPSDLKNVKPWVWSEDPVVAMVYKLIGASATPLPVPSVMQNLTTGQIDTIYASPVAAVALNWFNYSKYITNLVLNVGVGATVVTKKAWSQATPEQQAIIRRVNDKWHKVLINKIRKDNGKAVRTLKKRGVTVVKLSAADKAAWAALFVRVQDKLAGKIYPKSLLDQVRRLVKEAR